MNTYHHQFIKIPLEDDVFDEILSITNNYTEFSPSIAGIYNGETYVEQDQKNSKRKSKSITVVDASLTNTIETIVRAINIQANWNFDLSHVENPDYIRYDVGDYFSWHPDEADWTPGKRQFNRLRKLSYTILLNDEFQGGEFDMFTTRELTFNLKKKDMLIFHSDILHQVRPVTSGTRYSLVGWVQGPPWR